MKNLVDLLIIDEIRKKQQEEELNQIQLEIPRYHEDINNKIEKDLRKNKKEPKRVIIIDL